MATRPSGPGLSHDVLRAVEVPTRAQQLLAAGDLRGYRELFARLEELEDPHRRYWVGCSMLERGFAASAGRERDAMLALFTTLAACVVEMLEREPREPKLLNWAGVVFFELWSLEAAEALFKAARRLDPQLPDVDGNLVEVGARKRLLRGARRRTPLHAQVPALSRRALAVADRARPARGLTLSLCMIVRDEQEMLPRCLAAVAGAVDEIVIVDTGSTDATIEIARSFGAMLIEREWTGSFAQARNVSFDAARGDWLLYLDADEVLVREDARLLRSLTGRTWREAFYLCETNYTGELAAGTAVTHNALRVFRNRPEYRFEGRLHEQIAHHLPGYLPERLEASAVRVEHFGYLGAVRDSRGKAARNIELLRMQQREGPPTPFLHYNLGSEYAAAGDARAALAEFERAWSLLKAATDRSTYEFAPALCSRLVKALRACGRPEEAAERAREGLERFEGFTDLVLEQAFAAVDLGERDRAAQLFERCIAMGDASRRYTATVGCGTYLPRIHLAELKSAEGLYDEAVALLEHALLEQPQFVGTVIPYASALLARGDQPEEVAGALERALGEPSPAARFLLGTALYEAGAVAAGEAQFRAVLECQPHSARARVALAETLLAQRRYEDAAAVACALAADDPLAVIASRTELFGLLAARTPEPAGAALERARAAGMAAAELELFEAWKALLDGDGDAPHALAEEAVGALERMLEALVRVGDFEGFELLLALLPCTPLPERERRELLAELYLRRGFGALAAEEWMAVCAAGPDERALIGLARVSLANGMAVEAAEFAAAALELNPAGERAAQLLAHARERAPSAP